MEDTWQQINIKIFEYEGLFYPAHSIFPDVLKSLTSMIPKDKDIFLCSYPRCGSTWTQCIIWSILNSGDPLPARIHLDFPHLEMTDAKWFENRPAPRLFKLHMPYRLTPKSDSANYICIVRNIFDCCISDFKSLKENYDTFGAEREPEFKVFLDTFVKGKCTFGNYFETSQSWFEQRDEPNVLFLTYEEQSKDPRGSILKIAKFMGTKYIEQLNTFPDIIDNIVNNTSFKKMKESNGFRYPSEVFIEDVKLNHNVDQVPLTKENSYAMVNHVREGKVGNSHKILNPDEVDKLRNAVLENIKYPELQKILLNES